MRDLFPTLERRVKRCLLHQLFLKWLIQNNQYGIEAYFEADFPGLKKTRVRVCVCVCVCAIVLTYEKFSVCKRISFYSKTEWDVADKESRMDDVRWETRIFITVFEKGLFLFF